MNSPAEPSIPRRLVEILGLAAAYFGTGKLGLLLAIPPGYATAIWPPSGIALAALLVIGTRAWPGVFLGSFLVNVFTSLSPGVAAAIGAGASAQAMTGAFLIRRYLGPAAGLLRGRDVVTFVLLGGPASCVVGATVGVATLYVRKLVQLGEMPFSWWTWWTGDVIGVAVVTPMVLIALGEPREIWRRRAVPVGIPLAALFVLSAALFLFVSAWEQQQISTTFTTRAERLNSSIFERATRTSEMLQSLEDFRAATPQFDRKSFHAFAGRLWLDWESQLQAISWNPRVRDADREMFERGGSDGTDGACKITERDAKDRLVPATRRNEYVPVRYIEPPDENAGVVGFDVSSGIVRFEAIQTAGDEGLSVATRKIRLMQDKDETFGMIVFHPVYAKATDAKTSVEERRRNLVGFFAAVLRLDDFFYPLARLQEKEGINVEIQEAKAVDPPLIPPGVDVLWQAGATRGEIQHRMVSSFWGRLWCVTVSASPAYVSAARSWRPWGVLAAGMAAAGAVGAFLLAATGRAILIERK